MKTDTYRVYKHPVKGYAAVKEGYNWTAFLFGPVWLLYKRLWGSFAAISTIWLMVFVLAANFTANLDSFFLVTVVVAGMLDIYIGSVAESMLINNLSDRGFDFLGMYEANTEDEAIAIAVR